MPSIGPETAVSLQLVPVGLIILFSFPTAVCYNLHCIHTLIKNLSIIFFLTFSVQIHKSLSNKTADNYTIYPTHNTSKRFKFLHLACIHATVGYLVSHFNTCLILNWKLKTIPQERKKKKEKNKQVILTKIHWIWYTANKGLYGNCLCK